MMTKIRKCLKQKGFTLVELMVVIAILGVLGAIAIPKFTDSIATANTAKIAADLRTIDSAIVMYQAQNGGTAPTGIGTDSTSAATTLTGAGLLVVAPQTPAGDYYLKGKKSKTPLTKATGYSIARGRAIITGVRNNAEDFYK